MKALLHMPKKVIYRGYISGYGFQKYACVLFIYLFRHFWGKGLYTGISSDIADEPQLSSYLLLYNFIYMP